MAWTQDDIDALKTALRLGQRVVRHGETYVEYRSFDEMKQLLAMMQGDVTTRVRTTVAAFRNVR